jgi:hypothetical protein
MMSRADSASESQTSTSSSQTRRRTSEGPSHLDTFHARAACHPRSRRTVPCLCLILSPTAQRWRLHATMAVSFGLPAHSAVLMQPAHSNHSSRSLQRHSVYAFCRQSSLSASTARCHLSRWSTTCRCCRPPPGKSLVKNWFLAGTRP